MHLQDSRKISTLNVTQGHGNKAVLRPIRGGVIFLLPSAKKFHGPGSTRKEQTEVTKALSSLWGVTVLARGFSEQDAFFSRFPEPRTAHVTHPAVSSAEQSSKVSGFHWWAPELDFYLCSSEHLLTLAIHLLLLSLGLLVFRLNLKVTRGL